MKSVFTKQYEALLLRLIEARNDRRLTQQELADEPREEAEAFVPECRVRGIEAERGEKFLVAPGPTSA